MSFPTDWTENTPDEDESSDTSEKTSSRSFEAKLRTDAFPSTPETLERKQKNWAERKKEKKRKKEREERKKERKKRPATAKMGWIFSQKNGREERTLPYYKSAVDEFVDWKTNIPFPSSPLSNNMPPGMPSSPARPLRYPPRPPEPCTPALNEMEDASNDKDVPFVPLSSTPDDP
jgi:hypothetical protein